MSAIGASLIGTAVLAMAAIWFSLQNWLSTRSDSSSLFDSVMKMLVTAGLAVGICLIVASVAELAQLAPSVVEMVALFAIPMVFLGLWRSLGVAVRDDRDGEAKGGLPA
jgi:hypothetical protein